MTAAEQTSPGQAVRLVYFAWVRERIGLADETTNIPAGIATVAELLAWQRSRGPAYEQAFARSDVIRTAIDQRHAAPTAAIAGAREIAFFPPVTGG